jgi:hypothetical protein
MSNNSVKNIPVKAYLSADFYLDTKAKCEEVGISMSAGIALALSQWEPLHRIRRPSGMDRPKPVPKRTFRLPGNRPGRVGGPIPHPRV